MNEMLDYVKAMSDPNRLRIIGLLSQESATREEVAKRLKLSVKDSLTHLGFLEFVGAITQTDGVFTLNDDKLAVLAKEKLAEMRPSYVPAEHWDEKSKKILKAHLNADGSIKQIPASPKLQVILNYLVEFFDFDRNYTEKEVNTILRKYNEDTAGLRRDLVDAGMMARESDGSRYWRVKVGDA
jgi:ArsR family transcriptional regulator, arsenate/arsenite/antimonite-responsive transcriptional repressor